MVCRFVSPTAKAMGHPTPQLMADGALAGLCDREGKAPAEPIRNLASLRTNLPGIAHREN